MSRSGRPVAMAIGLVIAALAACGGAQPEPDTPSARGSEVCIVRHAQAYKNLEPRPTDVTDEQIDSLTPEGEARARERGATLPPPVELIWTSPTNRTRQTAALLGRDAPIEIVDELGGLEGDPADFLERVRAALEPGEHAVLVTHWDVAAALIGELEGTPPPQRQATHVLDTGEAGCLPLRQPHCAASCSATLSHMAAWSPS